MLDEYDKSHLLSAAHAVFVQLQPVGRGIFPLAKSLTMFVGNDCEPFVHLTATLGLEKP
jgi:hypothetical protein